jgi:hypothetical protein
MCERLSIVVPLPAIKKYGGGEAGLELHSFLTPALDEGDWSARNPG